MGGSLLESAHGLGDEGRMVRLRFAIPVETMQEEVPLTLAARILHVERREAGITPPTWRHGVVFQSLDKGGGSCCRTSYWASC